MKEKTMEQENESQTLAYRLKRGDKLWIEGHFVELVKSPKSFHKPMCEICGFNRNCTKSVWDVCLYLVPDEVYRYCVGLIGRQYAKQ